MSIQSKPTSDAEMSLNPYVSGLASRLIQTAANAELPVDSTGWQLIAEVLSYAASAEQRMAEQQERIALLEQVSVTDELTSIPNRRGLKNALGRILASTARKRENGVFAFIDLDGFKDINDTYGHMAGDAVLRHVAGMLRRAVRPQDAIARIGGDEFAIILTDCSEEDGRNRLSVIQETINETPAVYADMELKIGCSLGMRSFDSFSDPQELITAADCAMYRDKLCRRQA